MKISKITIIILGLSLITLVVWISYSISRLNASSVVLNEVDEKYTRPLKPSFDSKLLEDLKQESN